MIEGLRSLCRRSLLSEDAGVYSSFAFVREYAEAKLDAEAAARVRDRHKAHYASLCDLADPPAIARERDNVLAALEAALQQRDADAAPRLCRGVIAGLSVSGLLAIARSPLERTLALPGLAARDAVTLRGKLAEIEARIGQGDPVARAQAATADARRCGEPALIAEALDAEIVVHRIRHDIARVEASALEQLEIATAAGDRRQRCNALVHLATCARGAANPALARERYRAALAIAEDRRKDEALLGLGALEQGTGRHGAARSLYERVIARARSDRAIRAEAHMSMCSLAVTTGDLEGARSHLDSARALARGRGVASIQPRLSQLAAEIAELGGDLEAALDHARQIGAAGRALGIPHYASEGILYTGWILGRLGRTDDAIAALQTAIARFDAPSDAPWRASARAVLASALLDVDRLALASREIAAALPVLAGAGPIAHAFGLAVSGLVAIAKGEDAAATLARARALAPEPPPASFTARWIERLARAVEAHRTGQIG